MILAQSVIKLLTWHVYTILEGGKMQRLSSLLKTGTANEDSLEQGKQQLVDYFVDNRNQQVKYAWHYMWCELLQTANVFIQIEVLDQLLQNKFWSLGLQFLFGEPPGLVMFPLEGSCALEIGGPSGGTTRYDILCILPLHPIMDKCFIFLW